MNTETKQLNSETTTVMDSETTEKLNLIHKINILKDKMCPDCSDINVSINMTTIELKIEYSRCEYRYNNFLSTQELNKFAAGCLTFCVVMEQKYGMISSFKKEFDKFADDIVGHQMNQH